MKRDGVKLIEIIADKIFLGVFALALLAVIAMQFLGPGPTVRITNRDLPPDRAYEEVARLAQTKLAQLESNDVPAEIPTVPPKVVERLEAAVSERPVEAPTIPLGRALTLAGGSSEAVAGIEALRVDLPTPPAPGAPVARAFGLTLDPFELDRAPELRSALLDPQGVQPLDAFAISVQVEFDAAALRAALERDPDGAGPLVAIPSRWWRNRLDVLDVRVERREVFEDGRRGPAALLDPLPGVLSLRDQLGAQHTAASLNRLVQRAAQADAAEQIRQPRFYAAIAGEPWIPPADAQPGAKVDPRVEALRRLRAEISDVERELDRLRRQAAAPGAPAVAQVSRPGGGGGGGGGKGNTPSVPDRDTRVEQGRQQRIDTLQARLAELQTQATDIEGQLIQAGLNPDTGRPDRAHGAAPAAIQSPRDAETVPIWMHDITVEPGATYEYRIALVLPNPLFGYDEALAQDARELAATPSSSSAFSPWSDPVQAPERSSLFVESATAPDANALLATPGGASITQYQFYYGYWRAARVRVSVGDAIVPEIDLPAPLPIWDIESKPPAIADQIRGPIPAAGVDLFLLDVLAEPSIEAGVGAGREMRRAVLLGRSDGAVFIRRPVVDREDPRLARLRDSARAAQSATVLQPGTARSATVLNRAQAPTATPDGAKDTRDRPAPLNRPVRKTKIGG